MIAPNDTLSNPANFTPPMQASLLCAARCKQGWHVGENCRIWVAVRSPNASSQIVINPMSWFLTQCGGLA